MYIVLLGAPGSGKGTQATRIAGELKMLHISSGDLFREVLKQDTPLALKVKAYVEKGELVPDELTVRMVLDRIATVGPDSGVALDGFPRNLAQAEALDKSLAGEGKAIDGVVYIKVSDDELLRRLSGRLICRGCQQPYHLSTNPPKVAGKCDKCQGELYQRADDVPETIKRRLKVYAAETAPLIDYYARKGVLIEVDGEGDAEIITERITKTLAAKSAAR